MSRSERLFRLMNALRVLPKPVTAARLAAETEVSERTLYRDIESLRNSGARIEGAPGLGYTLSEDPALPPQTFDRIEMEALVVGLSDVRQRGDVQLAKAAETALAKIVATLPERLQRQVLHATHMVYRYEQPEQASADLSDIRLACWEEQALDLRYRDGTGAVTERRVYPLAIVYLDRGYGLLAWCCLRQDFRKFLVGRMEAAIPTSESFRPRRVSLLREYIALLYD
ncbi:HTH domain-containing protein [Pseudooceanicola antarcticus]|uniref:HTH domain-containing protein n=1 Tax=Pseudooceanicola antarcticus TaxID=1247613 RepID=A0A285J796_9RHOB|nr:YafY family protein [Pseudooceanicola antarcticus]PJE27029.1 YafY family transcriptional regulator [Pseudooceanicola antarcticus]SNY56210.1 HTH domain-containing protein [Pseudooceanicola antarcticus]